jgi:RNA polymerase sigma-70 factor (ECF subfamily)
MVMLDPSAMTCREMLERLSEYLDQELGEELRTAFRAHLAGCEPCEAFCRSLRRTVELCRQLPSDPIPEAVHRDLVAFLAREYAST